MGIETIWRAIELPAVPLDAPDWFRSFIYSEYAQLAQQVRLIQNSVRSQRVAVAALAGSQAVLFTKAFPNTNYSMAVVSSWATAHSITAIAATGFTDTFAVAAPVGGGTLYVLAIA